MPAPPLLGSSNRSDERPHESTTLTAVNQAMPALRAQRHGDVAIRAHDTDDELVAGRPSAVAPGARRCRHKPVVGHASSLFHQ